MKIELFVERGDGELEPVTVTIGDPVLSDPQGGSESGCEVAITGVCASTRVIGETPMNAVENALLHVQSLLDEEGRSKGRRFWWCAAVPYF